jgi:hypothetical protein
MTGTGGLGTGGRAGTTRADAASTDTGRDATSGADSSDAIVECEPGFPVGSSSTDGCNTCICMAGGAWGCTARACPPDAAADAPADAGLCPTGQRWCPGCTAGTGTCSPAGGVCPASPCPVPDGGDVDASVLACSQLTTQAACQARSDCHTIFSDPGTCGCAAAGCCARFSRCADGKAVCTKPAQFSCAMVQPYCESPYVLAYRDSCFEGCVLGSDCPGSVDSGAREAGGDTGACNGQSCGSGQYCRAGCCGVGGCVPPPSTCESLPAACNGTPTCQCVCGMSGPPCTINAGIVQCGCG